MSQQSVLALAALLCCLAPAAAGQSIGAVRPEHPDLRKMIEEGLDRSATFRTLVDQLNASSMVVYVRFGRCTGAVAACTRFVTPQGTTRRLLIVLDRFGRAPWQLIALLAHELQHALEIAEAPNVVDLPSFHHFYATTGLRVSAGYETDAAIRVARIVASELAKRRPH
jgi:hypothetical protein